MPGELDDAIGALTLLTTHQPIVSHEEDWLGMDQVQGDDGNGGCDFVLPSYSQIAQSGVASGEGGCEDPIYEDGVALCPYYYSSGVCPHDRPCVFVHGDQCPACMLFCLTPASAADHMERCVAEVEQAIALDDAMQQSEQIECGICYDLVLSKAKTGDRRFGILENCDHAFCLSCIRNWRHQGAQQFSTVRKCPLCQLESHFVVPSSYWVPSGPEKTSLIQAYQSNLASKDCMYFRSGDGECPFGTSCFYRHRNKDGSEHVPAAPRFYMNADGEVEVIRPTLLSDFLADRLS